MASSPISFMIEELAPSRVEPVLIHTHDIVQTSLILWCAPATKGVKLGLVSHQLKLRGGSESCPPAPTPRAVDDLLLWPCADTRDEASVCLTIRSWRLHRNFHQVYIPYINLTNFE